MKVFDQCFCGDSKFFPMYLLKMFLSKHSNSEEIVCEMENQIGKANSSAFLIATLYISNLDDCERYRLFNKVENIRVIFYTSVTLIYHVF